MTIPILKLEYIKVNQGYYYKSDCWGYPPVWGNQIFNHGDVSLRKSDFSPHWLFSTKEIVNVEKLIKGVKKPSLYILKEAYTPSEQIPQQIPYNKVEEEWDDAEDYRVVVGEFKDIIGMYELQYEQEPDEIVPVEFESKCLGEYEVSDSLYPEKMTIKIKESGSWGKENISEVDLSSIVVYSDLEKIITPAPLLYTRPCKLSSEQVYRIVRSHIKENIDGKYARVTSDYDFCFTVKKVVSSPDYFQKEIKKANNQSYKKPRFKTEKKENLVEIFEMTHKGKGGNYGSYTPIADWEAPNLKELQENIKQYLEDLMDVINAPVVQCEHCKGIGTVLDKKPTNER